METNSLTMGELLRLEKLVGRSAQTFQDPDRPQSDVLAGMAFLLKSRTDKSFTYEMALAMTADEVVAIVAPEGGDEAGES